MTLSKPRLALRVQSLERSLHFYRGTLGCELECHDPAQGVAQVRLPGGLGAVLTSDRALDLTPYMDAAFSEPGPGHRNYLPGTGLDSLQQTFMEKGVTGMTMDEDAGFWRHLNVTDPDGYLFSFFEELPTPDDVVLSVYRKGPDLLDEAIAGLTDADLDLVRAPGKWSIRQIVLHLIDSDLGMTHRMKFALAEPGRNYALNPYSQDRWADGLDYAHRPIRTEVALFRLNREHILGLCDHFPDAFDRSVGSERGAMDVRKMMKMLAGHARGHINQIWQTRKVHSK